MSTLQVSTNPTPTEISSPKSNILDPLPFDYFNDKVSKLSLNALQAQVIKCGKCLRKKPNGENRQILLQFIEQAKKMSLRHVNDPQENTQPEIMRRAMFYSEIQSIIKDTKILDDYVMSKWDQVLRRMQANEF